MNRHHLAGWGLLATLLLAACAATQPSTITSSSATALAVESTSVPTAHPSAPTIAPAKATVGTDSAAIKLAKLTSDLQSPVFVTHAGDKSNRMFVVEKKGTIAILRDGKRAATPFLDITNLVTSSGSEQGLLGLAFHP